MRLHKFLKTIQEHRDSQSQKFESVERAAAPSNNSDCFLLAIYESFLGMIRSAFYYPEKRTVHFLDRGDSSKESSSSGLSTQ